MQAVNSGGGGGILRMDLHYDFLGPVDVGCRSGLTSGRMDLQYSFLGPVHDGAAAANADACEDGATATAVDSIHFLRPQSNTYSHLLTVQNVFFWSAFETCTTEKLGLWQQLSC